MSLSKSQSKPRKVVDTRQAIAFLSNRTALVLAAALMNVTQWAPALSQQAASTPAIKPGGHAIPITDDVREKAFHKVESAFASKGLKFTEEPPKNFPVPVYPSNVTYKNFTSTTKGQVVATELLMTKDDAKDVYQWYTKFCSQNGWQVRTPKTEKMAKLQKDGKAYFFNAQKTKQQMNISVIKNPKHPGSAVSINFFVQL